MAAFDFDGTIIAGDSFVPFLRLACGAGRSAVALGRSVVASAVHDRGLDRDGIKTRLVARLLTGRELASLVPVARAHALDLVARVRPEMAERIEAHRREGDLVVIVSASLELYLATVAEMLGIDAVLATRLEVDPDGRLTGALEGPNCRGPEKAVRLAAFVRSALAPEAATAAEAASARISAYGDSAGDDEMMAMAQVCTWVGRRASRRRSDPQGDDTR